VNSTNSQVIHNQITDLNTTYSVFIVIKPLHLVI